MEPHIKSHVSKDALREKYIRASTTDRRGRRFASGAPKYVFTERFQDGERESSRRFPRLRLLPRCPRMSTAPGTVVQRAVARRRRRDPVCARGSVWQQTFLGSVQFRTMKRRTTSILTLQEAKLNRWSSLALHLSLLAWGTCSAAAQGRASQGLLPSGGACSAAAEGTHAQLACAPSRRIRERRLCREQGDKEEYSRRQRRIRCWEGKIGITESLLHIL